MADLVKKKSSITGEKWIFICLMHLLRVGIIICTYYATAMRCYTSSIPLGEKEE